MTLNLTLVLHIRLILTLNSVHSGLILNPNKDPNAVVVFKQLMMAASSHVGKQIIARHALRIGVDGPTLTLTVKGLLRIGVEGWVTVGVSCAPVLTLQFG